jgi:uncharacterized membrane protein YgcG
MRPASTLTAIAALLAVTASPAVAQSLSDRIDRVRQQQAQQNEAQRTDRTTNAAVRRARPSTQQLLNRQLESVNFDQTPAREALERWSERTGVDLVINWNALDQAGFSPDTPITVRLNYAPAGDVLELMLDQIGGGTQQFGGQNNELIAQATPWYVEVISKQQANRRTVLRMYDVRDLLMEIPNFTNAPAFDLRSALQSGGTGDNGGGDDFGGGGGDDGGGLFGEDEDEEEEEQAGQTRQERAEELEDLIRSTIEPDIWRENGGQFASIRYFRGMLVVNAPQYVHQQIGIPVN